MVLTVLNLVVYATVCQYDFVNWDDPEYVSENPHVVSGLTWRGVSWAFTSGHAANWHPLTWLSHMLDTQLYGLKAGPHHLTNLLLHIANTLLLFGLLHRMTGALAPAAFVAAMFAVHPLHVESVAWVAERKDVLSTLFWMLTLWAYVGYARQPRQRSYVAVFLFCALGLMAKPMLVTLPLVLLLLDVWPLGRAPLGADRPGGAGVTPARALQSAWLPVVREKLPLLLLTIASGLVTLVVQQRGGTVARLEAIPLSHRVENALVSYVGYIGKMLWPTHLAPFYPYPRSLPILWVVAAFLGLVGASIAVIRAAPRHPYLAVGWFWYLGMLAPVIGLIQVGDQSMADRYTYVPLIGVWIIVAWGSRDLLARWPFRRSALLTVAGVVIAACTLTARTQVKHWKDSTALWTHALQVTTGNYLAYNNLGVALEGQGKVSEAIANYTEALRIKPDYPSAHSNLGVALTRQGRVGEAIAHYTEALRLKPDDADAHHNLGAALAYQGKISEAITHYTMALRLKPDFQKAHTNLGIALASQGKTSEAIGQYSEALRLKPDDPLAHNGLGSALVDQGRVDEAIAQYTEALRLKPDDPLAHNGLGVALDRQGRVDEAIAHYTEALRINPDFADAHSNLGGALAKQERIDEALRECLDALRLKPDQATFHYNVAVLLERKGTTTDARRHLETALELDPSHEAARRALDDLTSRSTR